MFVEGCVGGGWEGGGLDFSWYSEIRCLSASLQTVQI